MLPDNTAGRHRGVKAFGTDPFVLSLPAGHRFPMEKYRLLRERVEDTVAIHCGTVQAAYRSRSRRDQR